MDAEASSLDQQLSSLKLTQEDLETMRERRKLQLKKEAKKNELYKAQGHGHYDEVTSTKEFFNLCKTSDRVVCHFYRSSTKRCEIVDKHLQILCSRHLETKFIKVNVEKHQFLCERLNIYVLPSIVTVIKGKTEKTFKGFEEFGNLDDFDTRIMEQRLKDCDVLTSLQLTNENNEAAIDKLFIGKQLVEQDSENEENEDANTQKIRQSAFVKHIDSDEEW